MYRIIDGKGTGKTSRLFLLAKENAGVIVCFDPEVLRHKAYSYGITGLDFISYYDFLNQDVPYQAKNIYIDDIEFFAHYVAGCTGNFFDGYTLSNED